MTDRAGCHEPVLLDEAIGLLNIRAGKVYCDATLGSAGHARAILEHAGPDGFLIGVDRDSEALDRARDRLQEFSGRLALFSANFAGLDSCFDQAGISDCDGLLLDLGISSDQLDSAERGFTFSQAGPLDMRMDRTQPTAAVDLLRDLSADELADLLVRYGEQPAARRIAAAIKNAWRAGQIQTTRDLARVVLAAAPKHGYSRLHPATRVFMALRIAVNQELDCLARFLATFPPRLRLGGRVVIIAFHSLEDRMVKQRLRELARADMVPPRFSLLTRKPLRPSSREVARNPRARSARLRAAERVA